MHSLSGANVHSWDDPPQNSLMGKLPLELTFCVNVKLYKMTLMIDQLVMDEIISQPDEGKIKGFMVLKYFYGPELEPMPKVRIDRKFKTFKSNFKGKVNYSLAIKVDETNREFFNFLEERLAFLASKRLDGRPENYRLIKESKG